MIYFLYGPNTYEIDRGLAALLSALAKNHPDVGVGRLDATELTPDRLPDILQGVSLFNEHRIVVLRSPSANKPLWLALESYVNTVADTTDLIIVDTNADKRTKTFKALSAVAKTHEYAEFAPRNAAALQTWIAQEAAARGLTIPRESVTLLIDRVGYDQWSLANAIEKLALVEDASPERIRDIIEPSPSANAFEIFEAALRGEQGKVRTMLADLQMTGDPHALLGLLGSQCYQLALVTYSSKTPVELGKHIGSSPYPLQKLNPVARKLTKAQVQFAVETIAACDDDMKHSVAAPWTLITRALLKIAQRATI